MLPPSTDPRPATVVLVHGTFASSAHDTGAEELAALQKEAEDCRKVNRTRAEALDRARECFRARWWQTDGGFAENLDRLLGGTARCWGGLPGQNGRRVFTWSGKNSDLERRRAGASLYDELLRLEEAKQPYHLVGHSHGGTVIWHALELAARDNQALPGLRSWTTLGTPFPTFRADPGMWVIRLAVALALVLVVGVVARFGFGFPVGAFVFHFADVFQNGMSLSTRILLAGPALLVAFFVLGLLVSCWLWVQQRREDAWSRAAWDAWGERWLGVFSDNDEAIAVCRASVGIYFSNAFRIPEPSLRPAKFEGSRRGVLRLVKSSSGTAGLAVSAALIKVFNGVVMPLTERVLNFILRGRIQGADRLGTLLAYVSPEPRFHANSRGSLAGLGLEEQLFVFARSKVEVTSGGSYEWVVAQLGDAAKGEGNAGQRAREIAAGLKVSRDLIHCSYPEVPEVRVLVALHIRGWSGASGPPDFGRAWAALSADDRRLGDEASWLEWLGRTPGAGLSPFPPRHAGDVDEEKTPHRTKPKPLDGTPLGPRLLLAGVFAVVLLVGVVGVKGEVERQYVPYLVEQVNLDEDELAPGVPERLEAFRPLSDSALASAVGQDVTTNSRHVLRVVSKFSLKDANGARAVVGQLVENLRRADVLGPELQKATTEALIRVANDHPSAGAPERLADLLSPENATAARRLAVFALGRIDLADHLEPGSVLLTRLTNALADQDTYVRIRAADVFRDPTLLSAEVFAHVAEGVKRQREGWDVVGVGVVRSVGQSTSVEAFLRFMWEVTAGKHSVVSDTAEESFGRIGRSTVPILVADLKGTDVEARRAAAALGRLKEGAASAVQNLTVALKSEDASVRRAAAEALGRIGEKAASAISPLIDALKDPNIGAAAEEALGRIGAKAVPALIDALKDTTADTTVRRAAAVTLGRIGEKVSAVLTLATVLKGTNVGAAAVALRRIGEKAVPALIDALKSEDASVRRTAAEALGRIGESAASAVPPLADALKGEDTTVRRVAAVALGRIGEKAASAVPNLADALKDPNIGAAAEEALGRIGAKAVPALIDALKDTTASAAVRRGVAVVLGGMGEKAAAAVPDLILALNDTNPELRDAAVSALGGVGGGKAVSALAKILRDPALGEAAASALGRIGEKGVPALIDAVKDTSADVAIRQAAAVALGQIGEKASSAVPPLAGVLKDKNAGLAVRRAVAEALGRIGAKGVPDLIATLNRKNTEVSQYAATALGVIGEKASPAVVDLIAAVNGTSPIVRLEATVALGWIGERDLTVPALIAALKHSDSSVSPAAAEALGRIGEKERTVPALIAVLTAADTAAEVRAAAAAALGRLGEKALPQLSRELTSHSEAVRKCVCDVLTGVAGKSGGERALALVPPWELR